MDLGDRKALWKVSSKIYKVKGLELGEVKVISEAIS